MNELDPALIAQAAGGDRRALKRLSDALLPRVHALAYRLTGVRADAEDITQEAFLRLWKVLPDWDPGRAKLSTWLYRVTTNLAIDRQRRRREAPLPEGYDAPGGEPTPEAALSAGETRAEIAEAVSRLPERQRAAIILSHFEELGNDETAEILGISVEAVESLLSRGRRALRQALTHLRRDISETSVGETRP